MQLTSLNDITTKYRHIFLSPHFDDVVYSCGGTLGVQLSNGLHSLVITIFGGVPSANTQLSSLATQMHREMGINPSQGVGAAIETRRKEDAAALDYLQVDYLWLDYLEAIYRGSPAYYTTKSQLTDGDVNSADLTIDHQLAQDLVALQERLPDTVWYAPLGIGRHVDHQLVSSAADRLVQRGAKVYLYEEFPAVLKAGAREARIQELGEALEPALVEMSEMLPYRLEAADMYTSQIGSNFGDQATMHKAMETYTHNIRPVETICLERYWTA
ncbi:MAG: PIG-L family deacetylase [Ktedonobacteraceae bacterium]